MSETHIDILHVVPAYWPRAGGIETLVAGMAEGLQKQHGLKSAVITPRRPGDPQEVVVHEGITVVPVPLPALHDLLNNSKIIHGFFSILRKTYGQLCPKIIHLHGCTEIFIPACIVARASSIPCVHHIHGVLNEDVSPSYFREIAASPHVYAVSQAVADSVKPLSGRAGPVTVIPNSIRPYVVDAQKQKRLNDVTTVIMVGRLEGSKGFEEGLRAISRVVKAGRKVRAVIVGRGDLDAWFRQLSADLGIADLVEFKGEKNYAEAQDLIASSDILLAPSRDIEGFSLACLEAAFLEIPVIASATGGIPETVADGYSGQLVPPRDIDGFERALLRYLDDPELMRKHGLQARHRALEVFGYNKFIARWADEYRKVLHPAAR